MQTMLTVVTQNSRLLRRSALSGDRMAFALTMSIAGVHRRAYRRSARSAVYAGAVGTVGARCVLRRLWLSGLFLFRALRALFRNWLRLWVVLRRDSYPTAIVTAIRTMGGMSAIALRAGW